MLPLIPLIIALTTAERSRATWLPDGEACSHDTITRVIAKPNYNIAQLTHKSTISSLRVKHMESSLTRQDNDRSTADIPPTHTDLYDSIVSAYPYRIFEGAYAFEAHEGWNTIKGDDGWL